MVFYKGKTFYGSGFAIKRNVIVTNRHVIESVIAKDIEIVGKTKAS